VRDHVEAGLANIAKEIAAGAHTRLLQTTAEIAELEHQLGQLKAQRDGQIHAFSRLESYRPRAGATDFRCPSCWIADGRSIPLKPIMLADAADDILRCPACGRDFGFTLRR
jgi:hypothetical protein